MIRLGAVNIDTSHPLGFAEALQSGNRARYVGVYNDSFRGADEVEGFIRRFGLEKRCESLEELAEMSDLGMIHGCDWDDHLRCALPFIRRGKPVFIDKPLVGKLKDCQKVMSLAEQGAVILGASSARYAKEIQDFLSLPVAERGEVVQVLATGGVDHFNYGVHVVEAIAGILGQGARSVCFAGEAQVQGGVAETYLTRFESGASAVHTLYTGAWQPFALIVLTTKNTYTIQLDSSRLYGALLEELCNYMEGLPNRLVGPAALVESIQVMLAGKAAKETGRAVALSDLSEDGPGFDGAAFAKAYGAGAGKIYV